MGDVRISGLKFGKLAAIVETDSQTLADQVMHGSAKLYVQYEAGLERVTPEMILEERVQAAGIVDESPFELEGSKGLAESRSTPSQTSDAAKRDNPKYAKVDVAILSAALSLVSSDPEPYFKTQAGHSSLNADKLAGAIDDQRHRWPVLKEDFGTSREKIVKAIRGAIRSAAECPVA